MWQALSSHGVEVFDGELYFVGGESGTGALSLVEKYNPLANQWDPLILCLPVQLYSGSGS